jgi:TolB-like protein
MNRRLVAALVAMVVLAAAVLPALPKIAVLDAQIPATMDKSVVVPITDKIAEELVHSNQYEVLDRANVEQVLKEKEFQVSGMVQDSDIKQAGKYLGADFVVVARVSLIENTYFISAKMINVESGAVTAQVSDQEEGKAAVLLTIAERVGRKLVGGVIEPEKAPTATASGTTGTGSTATKPTGTQSGPAASAKRGPRSTITVEVGLPLFSGAVRDAADEWVAYWTGGSGATLDSTGGLALSGRLSFYVVGPLYLGATADYAWQDVKYTDYYGSSYSEQTFSTLDIAASVGVGFAVGGSFQVYAGAKIGLGTVSLGNFFNSVNWTSSWEGDSSAGLAYGLEAGADLILFQIVTVGARLQWMATSVSSSSTIGQATPNFFNAPGGTYSAPYDFSVIRLDIGAGIALGGKK